MKFPAFLFLFLALRVYAQSGEYLQPDSIYRLNHVKTRTINSTMTKAAVSFADLTTMENCSKGFSSTAAEKNFTIETSTATTRKTSLQTDTYVTYWYEGGTGLLVDSSPHPTKYWWTNALQYDTLNRLAHAVFTNLAGKVVGENTYTYNPLTVHSKRLSPVDSSRSTLTIIYDAPGVERRYNSYTEILGKVTNRWEEFYENTIDKDGKISKRKQTAPANPGWAMEYVYEYDNKGLLTSVISRRVDCTTDAAAFPWFLTMSIGRKTLFQKKSSR